MILYKKASATGDFVPQNLYRGLVTEPLTSRPITWNPEHAPGLWVQTKAEAKTFGLKAKA